MPEDSVGQGSDPSSETTEDCSEVARHLRVVYHAQECAVVGALREKYGEEALKLARRANYEAGLAAGHEALNRYRPSKLDLPTAADLVRKWGRGSPPTEVSERRLVYREDNPCAFWPVWRRAGLPLMVGCDYNGAWMEGFFHAINPKIEHGRPSWRPRGDSICEEVFELPER